MSAYPPGHATYVPGVCNIGPTERMRRKQTGLLGTAVTLVLLGVLFAVHAPSGWRVVVFFPATLAAAGFLQNAFHFCAAFGMAGVYNLVNRPGKTEEVVQAAFRRKDQRKALIIIGLSVAVGGVAAAFAVAI